MALSDYSEYFGDMLTDEKLYILIVGVRADWQLNWDLNKSEV